TPFAERVTGLLLRASGHELDARTATEEQRVLAGSLTSVWVHELLAMLRGQRTYDQIQHRLEITATRLLADFPTPPSP
ncbi:TetR/AcrR family transcriptional regulator, partial [Streptosporangium algeriense]